VCGSNSITQRIKVLGESKISFASRPEHNVKFNCKKVLSKNVLKVLKEQHDVPSTLA
jgi:hypothetical protein